MGSDFWRIHVEYSRDRLSRLATICTELNERLTFARARAAYALQLHDVGAYMQRLDEYHAIETQLHIYRYLIGCEWRRVSGVRKRTLPPALPVASWV